MGGIDGFRHPRERDWTKPTSGSGGKKRSGCWPQLVGLLAAPWTFSALLTGSVVAS